MGELVGGNTHLESSHFLFFVVVGGVSHFRGCNGPCGG